MGEKLSSFPYTISGREGGAGLERECGKINSLHACSTLAEIITQEIEEYKDKIL